MDVIALGELLIDFTIVGPPQEPWRAIRGSAGGAPANVLAMVARLGGTAQFIGKVGEDSFGDYLAASLIDVGIDTRSLSRSPQRTTLAFVTLGADGDRSFRFERNPGADTQLASSDLDETWFEDAKVFHFGSLSLTEDVSREATHVAIDVARKSGCVITYDPNLRPNLWKNLEHAKVEILNCLPFADVVKLSEEELSFLTGMEGFEDGVRQLRHLNSNALFLITLGPNGAYVDLSSKRGEVAPLPVHAVDTTAAGDAFFGAFLYRMTRSHPGNLLADVDAVFEAVRFANVAGALTTTRPGAFSALPNLQEIVSHL